MNEHHKPILGITAGLLIALAGAACAQDGAVEEQESRGSTALPAQLPESERCAREDGACPKVDHRPDPTRVYDVPVGDSPVRGSDDAKVTIVVACDFQCNYCQRVQPTLERVRETYGDSVRLVFKHNPLPFHKQAVGAAIAAEAAREQGKFWQMHDLLLANQQELGEAQYLAWAKQLELDEDRFGTDLRSTRLRDRVEADQRLVRSLGGKGTPSFWINGRFLNGAQPFARFNQLVFDLLAGRARASSSAAPAATPGTAQSDCGCEGQ